MNVPNNRKTKVYIVSEDNDICTGIETFKESIMPLMSASRDHCSQDETGRGR